MWDIERNPASAECAKYTGHAVYASTRTPTARGDAEIRRKENAPGGAECDDKENAPGGVEYANQKNIEIFLRDGRGRH